MSLREVHPVPAFRVADKAVLMCKCPFRKGATEGALAQEMKPEMGHPRRATHATMEASGEPEGVVDKQETLNPAEVFDGDWALIDLTEELTNRATLVANEMGLHFEEFMMTAIEEKLERLGVRHGPGRVVHW